MSAYADLVKQANVAFVTKLSVYNSGRSNSNVKARSKAKNNSIFKQFTFQASQNPMTATRGISSLDFSEEVKVRLGNLKFIATCNYYSLLAVKSEGAYSCPSC